LKDFLDAQDEALVQKQEAAKLQEALQEIVEELSIKVLFFYHLS
jgi:uncharacterized membrane-anchored protein